jgi:hypothetical protein
MVASSSRATQTVLAALRSDPTSTSELYDRVGYARLVQCGLVPYAAFRHVLAELAAEGLAAAEAGADGDTLWRLGEPGADGDGTPRR